jgi:hypothetical protein
MKFSLILNSRKRIELLFGLLNNIIEKTSSLEDIEILINFDSDDVQSLQLMSEIRSLKHPINNILKFEFRYRDQELIKSYNRMVSYASGEYIFVLNDDARIETQDWDKIAYPLLKEQGDIIYGRTSCNSADHCPVTKYASFPIISKKACDVLGFFMPDVIKTLGGDVAVFRIYEKINKIVDLPINLRHLMHETIELVFSPDNTASEMRSVTNEHLAWTYDINKDIEKLENYIKENNV